MKRLVASSYLPILQTILRLLIKVQPLVKLRWDAAPMSDDRVLSYEAECKTRTESRMDTILL